MVVLGLILLIIGLVAGISIFTTIGAILLIVGLILNLVPIGGTRRRVSARLKHATATKAPDRVSGAFARCTSATGRRGGGLGTLGRSLTAR